MSSDPNLNHEAVKIYRDMFLLCPNFGRRKEIVDTVRDYELWKSVLSEWKEQKHNPLKVNWMLSEYERREQNGTDVANCQRGERKRAAEDMQAGVSERREGDLSRVQEGARIQFRGNSKTLEQVVTEALRNSNRS